MFLLTRNHERDRCVTESFRSRGSLRAAPEFLVSNVALVTIPLWRKKIGTLAYIRGKKKAVSRRPSCLHLLSMLLGHFVNVTAANTPPGIIALPDSSYRSVVGRNYERRVQAARRRIPKRMKNADTKLASGGDAAMPSGVWRVLFRRANQTPINAPTPATTNSDNGRPNLERNAD